MAQGGFPTGSMNENEQQIVTGSMKKSGSIPIATAYGISIYSSATPSYLDKLISSYNTAIKIIQQISTRNGDINTSSIQLRNSFPTFTSICRNQDLKLLTKFIQGLLPVNTIYFNVPQVNTRKLDLLYIRKHRHLINNGKK